jgi:hypothetical protein
MSARAIKSRKNASVVLFFKVKDLPSLCGHSLLRAYFISRLSWLPRFDFWTFPSINVAFATESVDTLHSTEL